MAIALKEDRIVRGMEAVAERPDGTRVPFIPYPTPIHDEAGKLIGAVNMLVDITDRKRAEEQQALLVRELHHRVKNTLATVQAIMGSTARTVDNIEDFKTAIFGRIQSLAKTHLLLADDVKAVDFADILRSELDAFDSGIGGRITLQGPEVALHVATRGVARHGDPRAHDQCRKAWRAVGLRRQGGSDLERHHRRHETHAEFRLGRKRRSAGEGADPRRLRITPA